MFLNPCVLTENFPFSALEVVLMGLAAELPWYGKYSKAQTDQAMAMLDKLGMPHGHKRLLELFRWQIKKRSLPRISFFP